jgi:hypothetical protein
MLFLGRNFSAALRMLTLVAVAMLAAASLSAQTSTYTEYAAKFLCGVPASTDSSAGTIAPGEYSTSINIHNPNLFSTEKPLAFLKKAVLALPEGVALVPPSAFRQDSLPNDFAQSVNCSVIRSLLGTAAPPAPKFIEGFVVLVVPPAATPNQLDVVGVYTSSNGAPITLDVVPIPGRVITPPATGAALTGTIE